MSGVKNDEDKPDLTLIPYEVMAAMARGLMFGVQKYSRNNYTRGLSHTRLVASIQRHLAKWASGATYDKDAEQRGWKLTHVDLAASGMAMIHCNVGRHPELDDRGFSSDDCAYVGTPEVTSPAPAPTPDPVKAIAEGYIIIRTLKASRDTERYWTSGRWTQHREEATVVGADFKDVLLDAVRKHENSKYWFEAEAVYGQ